MKHIIIALLCFLFFLTVAQADETLMVVTTRPGVTQKVLLEQAEAPIAWALLFAGGNGRLALSAGPGKTAISRKKNNFLARSRHLLFRCGISVAVLDALSDRQSPEGLRGGFRTDPRHTTDIDWVIGHLQTIRSLPVWLVDTSRGTVSAAYTAIHSRHHLSGLVLTSAVTVKRQQALSAADLDLSRIALPVQIIAHRRDRCRVTPPSGAETIRQRLRNAQKTKVAYVEGGLPPAAAACRGLSAHGFYGIENKVIDIICDYIRYGR